MPGDYNKLMEQNGLRVRSGGNLMRCGSVSSQVDCYVTTEYADRGGVAFGNEYP